MNFTDKHKKLVFDTSRWQSYLYEMRGAATKETEQSLTVPLREDHKLSGAKSSEVEDFAHAVGRELFGRLYGKPERLDEADREDTPAWMDSVHETLDSMPDWDTLRKQVQSDPDFSALASNAMMKSLEPKLADLIKQKQKEDNGESQDEDDPSQITAQDAMRSAMRAACASAADMTSEGKSALAGIAPGLDASPPVDLQKDSGRFDLLQIIMGNPHFQEVARRAGRLRRISGRSNQTKTTDAYEEVVDVETGGDITRLLPSEIMNLMDDDLEILALSRIVEKTALQYKLEGREPQGRGPVVYIRDVSGSMAGDPHLWGAAVGVALSSQAAKEKRTMISCCFNAGVHAGRVLKKDGLHEMDPKALERFAHTRESKSFGKLTKLENGKLAQAKAALLHATDGISGGTDFGPAIDWALLAGVLEPKADFVFLTDGMALIDKAALDRLREAKKNGLRVYGMTVNGGGMSHSVAEICDQIVDIDSCKHEDEATNRIGRGLGRAR